LADLEKVKAETAQLQAQIKEKDATIQRLENNVKLLKRELGQ
jgi:archaellum component FlaC